MTRSDLSALSRQPVLWIFLNRDRALRNGWWAAVFLAILTALLFPSLLISIHLGRQLSIWEQAALVALATIAVQALRRRPVIEVTGPVSLGAAKSLALGLLAGFVLMAGPAGLLWASGLVRFEMTTIDAAACLSAIALMAGVAIAEELLFRGVLFQRLVAGVGVWPAQVAIGLLFVLTHLQNPGMEGTTRLWAGANIFLASLLFGQAFLRTRSLALPLGIHFMANITQGVLFGFGVSGNSEPSILTPHFITEADWLTGGTFGLEASLLGLLSVGLMLAWMYLGSRKTGATSTPRRARSPLRPVTFASKLDGGIAPEADIERGPHKRHYSDVSVCPFLLVEICDPCFQWRGVADLAGVDNGRLEGPGDRVTDRHLLECREAP